MSPEHHPAEKEQISLIPGKASFTLNLVEVPSISDDRPKKIRLPV